MGNGQASQWPQAAPGEFPNAPPDVPSGATPPTIESLSPTSAVVGTPRLLLTISGSGFDNGTTVMFGGNQAVIDEVSATEIDAIIRGAWLDTAGNIPVAVSNNTGSDQKTFTIRVSNLVPPFKAVTTPSPVSVRVGIAGPPVPVLLSDANGPVDISTAMLTLFVRSSWSSDNIPGGTVTATQTPGQAMITLPVLDYAGDYYAYITDERGGSYPDNGYGLLVQASAAATS